MKILLLLKKVNFYLLLLLSVSTGLVKLFQMPEEMVLFRNVHWSDTLIILFGVLQTLCGVLLIPSKTRKVSSLLLAFTYVIATGVVFANNMVEFGVVSILFILMALWSFFSPLVLTTNNTSN